MENANVEKWTELLTKREHEVAVRVAKGETNSQLATNLGISTRTVEKHIERILRKLGYSSRREIIIYALGNKGEA